MALIIDRLELLLDQLGIDLGGGNVAVPHHLLDGMEIRTVLQQMGREAVAQGMGVTSLSICAFS